jgi:cyclic pyranopterin phosphate synthase
MLVDRYGRTIDYLRISVTDRCNLRCEYCMPAEGTDVFEKGDVLRYEDLERIIGVAARLGMSKFRFTGGEPLIRRELVPFLGRVKRIPGVASIAISTNGLLLAQHAEGLRDSGVDKINISIDSFDRATFQRLTRRDVLPSVLNGLEAATRLSAFTIKINAVLLRGINDHELPDFLDLSIRTSHHVRFIEYMPFGEWHDRTDLVVPCREIVARIEGAGFVPDRGPSGNGPARYWRHPGAEGTVGVISPVTNKFCEGCNRVRLNARGELRGCLLDEGVVSLRDALASGRDEAVEEVFRRVLVVKPEKHYDLRTFHMSTIGG